MADDIHPPDTLPLLVSMMRNKVSLVPNQSWWCAYGGAVQQIADAATATVARHL